MSTPHRQFFLVHDEARRRAAQACQEAPEGHVVTIKPPKRTDGQNARFHAICWDIAKSRHPFAGKPRTAQEWKVLLVSAHAKATNEGAEIIPGIEGEFVAIRESTALMSTRRGASLIEYATAFATMHGIPLQDRPDYEPA